MGLLRFYLASCVYVWHHAPAPRPYMMFSYPAVLSFFIMSGFYMSLVLAEKYGPDGRLTFYANRALRLYPVYLAVLVLAALTGYASCPDALCWLDQALVLPNVAWHQVSLQIQEQDNTLRLGQYFVVGLEMIFYAIAPLIAFRRTRTLALLFVFAAALHVAIGVAGLPARPWQYEFFPGVLVYFIAGMLAYQLYAVAKRWRYPRALGWLALPVILALPLTFDSRHYWGWGEWPNYVIYGAVAVLTPFLFLASQRSTLDRLVGEVSYPLYVVQGTAIAAIAPLGITEPSLSAYVVTVLVAVMLFIAIDWPIERWRAQATS